MEQAGSRGRGEQGAAELGVRVAVVDPSSKIHFVPVVIERDTGATMELSSGLDGSERVVKIAGADLFEGKSVEVVQ